MDMIRKAVKRIPEEILREAEILLDELIYSLKPYLVTLTPPERQTLVKIEAESIKFLEVSHRIAGRNPELFPSFMKLAIFREEFSAAQELWTLVNKFNELKEKICDAELLAGNYAMETALTFYHTVKIAAKHDIPAARVIYEEFRPAYSLRKRKIRKANPAKAVAQPELFES